MNSDWIIPTLACVCLSIDPASATASDCGERVCRHENNTWRRNMNRSNLDFSPYRILAVAATVCLAPIWIPLALYIALTYSWEDTVPATEDL